MTNADLERIVELGRGLHRYKPTSAKREAITEHDNLCREHAPAMAAELLAKRLDNEYLRAEINRMRSVLEERGLWDTFCADYARSFPLFTPTAEARELLERGG